MGRRAGPRQQDSTRGGSEQETKNLTGSRLEEPKPIYT